MTIHRSGRGPDVVLFHGGMGSWKHWTRNIEPLAARFTVHALDHPSYGASAAVAREMTGAAYLDLVHRLFLEMFPGDGPLRFAGFSFGGAIAANLARRLAPRVTHLCLISPGGFPTRRFGERPTRSYKEAGDDEKLFREICRHNLLVNMLSDPTSVTEEAADLQRAQIGVLVDQLRGIDTRAVTDQAHGRLQLAICFRVLRIAAAVEADHRLDGPILEVEAQELAALDPATEHETVPAGRESHVFDGVLVLIRPEGMHVVVGLRSVQQ